MEHPLHCEGRRRARSIQLVFIELPLFRIVDGPGKASFETFGAAGRGEGGAAALITLSIAPYGILPQDKCQGPASAGPYSAHKDFSLLPQARAQRSGARYKAQGLKPDHLWL